jgi:nitrogen fixation protein FixH
MTRYIDTINDVSQERKLTGRHVLLMVVGFFSVLILVNGIFIYQAVDTFRGEDVERSYRQGLDYNQTINARRAQAQLGWIADIDTLHEVRSSDERELRINIRRKSGPSVAYDEMTGLLRHPVDTTLDIPLTFQGTNASVARASVPSGRWVFIGTAFKGDVTFTFRKELTFE